jgi:hypothetical protein
MKTKNSFLSLFGTAVLITLFISCSTNNEEQQITKPNAQNNSLARSGETISGHRGTLTIINNTDHQFSNVYFRCFQTVHSDGSYELQQLVKILPYSNITLVDFESTNDFGMCQAGDDKWTTTNYNTGATNSITGHNASNEGPDLDGNNFMTKYLNPDGTHILSVYWSSMGDNSTRSDDGYVRFRFKYYEEFSNDILISGSQAYDIGATHYKFIPNIEFDTNGNTTITLDEVSYL